MPTSTVGGPTVLIHAFTAAVLGTNCYVLSARQGSPASPAPALIVDPGAEVLGELETLVAAQHLLPEAVLLTHGHWDHTASAAAVAARWQIPVWIHVDDAYLLDDPLLALSPEVQIMVGLRQLQWQRPEQVHTFTDGQELTLAGCTVQVAHAPGHTPGSSLLLISGEDGAPICLSGDVLFNGSIGRTDLPGGDHQAMQRSLSSVVLALPDEMDVYPGHGPQTTIGMERMVNTYLRQVAGLPMYEPEV